MKWISPRFIFKVERWKWNKEYRVYVSNLGNFKNEHKQNLPFLINQNGYIIIKTENGYKLAHRLVMLTFCPIPNAEDLTVDHLDHNKRNNSVANLEWVSEVENQRRAKKDFVIIDQPRICFKQEGQNHYFDNVENAAKYLMQSKMWQGSVERSDEKFRTKEYVMQQIEKKIKSGGKYYGTWSIVLE